MEPNGADQHPDRDREPDHGDSSWAAVRADLLTLGFPEQKGSWLDYRSRGITEEHIGLLVDVLERQGSDPDQEEVPGAFAAVHAWRALAQLGAREAVPALIRTLDLAEEDDWTASDLPKALALMGPEVFDPLVEVVTDGTRGSVTRATAAEALTHLATAHPELRSRIGDVLAGVLAEPDGVEASLAGLLVGDLLDLQGVEWAPQMEAAYAAERVELMVCGDWEDVQIELGLLDERLTPPRPGAPGGGVGWEYLKRLEQVAAADARRKEARQARAEAQKKQKLKAKKKSRRARASRRKNRKK